MFTVFCVSVLVRSIALFTVLILHSAKLASSWSFFLSHSHSFIHWGICFCVGVRRMKFIPSFFLLMPPLCFTFFSHASTLSICTKQQAVSHNFLIQRVNNKHIYFTALQSLCPLQLLYIVSSLFNENITQHQSNDNKGTCKYKKKNQKLPLNNTHNKLLYFFFVPSLFAPVSRDEHAHWETKVITWW